MTLTPKLTRSMPARNGRWPWAAPRPAAVKRSSAATVAVRCTPRMIPPSSRRILEVCRIDVLLRVELRVLAICQDELVIRSLDEVLLPSFEVDFLVESRPLARRLHDAGIEVIAGDSKRVDTYLKADI